MSISSKESLKLSRNFSLIYAQFRTVKNLLVLGNLSKPQWCQASLNFYKEHEVSYKVAKSGKINWNRTIKNQKPYVQDMEVFYLDFERDKDSDKNYRYGTYRFEYVWEKMIDKVLGIENKADYFPKTTWYVNDNRYNNASLEPDTIMLYGKDVYVLDAKYYKYGVTGKTWDLPEFTSINKQLHMASI